MKKSSGFTLLEILLVVGIIAILAGIVILAINPTKMLSQTRNTQRKANLSEINKALYQYYIDNGHYPTTLTTSLTEICNTGATSSPNGVTCTGLIDLSALVPTYLTAIPTDPQPTASSTKYKVMKDASNRPVLVAHQAELAVPIAIGIWCPSPLVDSRDGKQYTTVAIGTQCWMQQNLNVGTKVAGATTQGTSCSSIQKYCYSDSEPNCTTYGGLYQWNQTMCGSTSAGATGICPIGWHVPTDTEFKTLVEGQATLGCESSDGWQCSPAGSHLSNFTQNHDNASGFTALLAGYRDADGGPFYYLSGSTFLWSSLEGDGAPWIRYLHPDFATVYRNAYDKAFGYSVRCLKD